LLASQLFASQLFAVFWSNSYVLCAVCAACVLCEKQGCLQACTPDVMKELKGFIDANNNPDGMLDDAELVKVSKDAESRGCYLEWQ
jgi:hypothetical protein